jgi:aromatic ring-cleaving dioxygenase
MRNAPNLDSNHNIAIRSEIGEQLRVLLSKEHPRTTPHVQDLLDCLSELDATRGGTPRV